MPELMEYTLDEHVAVLTMNSGENRFNLDFFEAINQALDEIEHETKASVLVVRTGHEKIWSNGIDLEWLRPAVQEGGAELSRKFSAGLNGLLIRMLNYPMICIAAINGHAFAGGAFLACAFDYRFMQTGRGFFCFPEVDIGIPFTPGLVALSKKAIPLYKLEEMEYTGKRVTAEECEAHHIIMKACPPDKLMDEVMAFAKPLNKDRGMLKILKERMNVDIVKIFEAEIAGRGGGLQGV